ncbi:MAG: hypothetical protein ACFCVK_13665 [Acidimicrobiales bacterium]
MVYPSVLSQVASRAGPASPPAVEVVEPVSTVVELSDRDVVIC